MLVAIKGEIALLLFYIWFVSFSYPVNASSDLWLRAQPIQGLEGVACAPEQTVSSLLHNLQTHEVGEEAKRVDEDKSFNL